jgi:hypothetical protein
MLYQTGMIVSNMWTSLRYQRGQDDSSMAEACLSVKIN